MSHLQVIMYTYKASVKIKKVSFIKSPCVAQFAQEQAPCVLLQGSKPVPEDRRYRHLNETNDKRIAECAKYWKVEGSRAINSQFMAADCS